MKHRNYKRPPKIRPKNERHPRELNSPEAWRRYLDDLEAAETEDCIEDERKREWKRSDEYAKRKELADRFNKRRML